MKLESSLRFKRAQKMAQKWGFLGLNKILIYSRVLFLLEYESTNGLLTPCENYMYGKNLAFDLSSKNLCTNHNVGFFKLQYHTNELSYDVKFLYVIRHSWKHCVYLVILTGWDQARFHIPKVMTNSKPASS